MNNQPVCKITLGRQVAVCAALCIVAVVVILVLQPRPLLSVLSAGLGLPWQVLVGAAIGGTYFGCSGFAVRYAAGRPSTRSTILSYSRLDLRGWNPLWIAMAAGIGEELLFRGALQPLLGIWVTSIVFVLVHVRAYQVTRINRTVLVQAAGIFVVSSVLGAIALFAGLIAAVIVHTMVDVAGLYAVRRMSLQHPAIA